MKDTQKIIAIIGMMVALLVNFSATAETILGCGCNTTGFSPITGESCAGNIPGIGPVPNQLPIGDADDMQAFAWEKVRQIGVFGWAESAIHSSTNVRSVQVIQYTPTSGTDIEEVFGIIRAQSLVLSVLYPSDTIQLQVGLYDTNGANLFSSYSSSGINPPRNGVSRNLLDVIFNMNSDVLIPESQL